MATIETRRTDDGTISHRVKIRLKGHPPETGSFSRLTDAKRWAQSTEAAIREGRYFKNAEAKRHTLADLVKRYISEELARKPKNARNITLHLNWWKQELGAYALSDVTPALITQCRNLLLTSNTCRKKLRSNATVVRYMSSLSHAFSVAMRDWGWIEDSPMRKVSKPKQARGRERFLSDDERKILLETCKQSASTFLYPVVILALSTGMRRGEIMELRWPQIDLIKGRILLHDTKNGSSRAVPLVSLAHQLIHDLSKVRRIDTNIVFYGPSNITRGSVTVSKKSLFISSFRRTYQEGVTAFNIVRNAYAAFGYRKADPVVVPLRIEIDSFISFVRQKIAAGEAWSAGPLRTPAEQAPFITDLIKQWSNTSWPYFEQTVVSETYPRLKDVFGSRANLMAANDSDLFDALATLHSFHDRFRFFEGGLSTWKREFPTFNDPVRTRETLAYLIYGPGDIVERMANAIFDPQYKLREFGRANVQELIGWLSREDLPVINSRTTKILRYFGSNVRQL